MGRLRAGSVSRLHATLSEIAASWRTEGSGPSVRRYAFRQGIAHGLASGHDDVASSLAASLAWALARSTSEGPSDAIDWARDVDATYAADPASSLAAWRHFAKINAPLMAASPPWWPSERSLLQLASEHGQDSPVTQAAVSLLEAGDCDWAWLRAARVPPRWFDGRDAVFVHDGPVVRSLRLNDRLVVTLTGGQPGGATAMARAFDVISGRTRATWGALDATMLRSGLLVSWSGPRLEIRAPHQRDLNSPQWSVELDGDVHGILETDGGRLFVRTGDGRCALVSLSQRIVLGAADLPGGRGAHEAPSGLHERRGEPRPILAHGESIFYWNDRAIFRLDAQADVAWEQVIEAPGTLMRVDVSPGGGLIFGVKARSMGVGHPPDVGTQAHFLPSARQGEAVRIGRWSRAAGDGTHLVLWDPDSGVSGAEDHRFMVHCEHSGRLLRDVQVHTAEISAVLAIGEGLFLSADEDANVALWSARSGEVIRRYLGHGFVDTMEGFRFGVQDLVRMGASRFATRGFDRRVCMFRFDDEQPLASFTMDSAAAHLMAVDSESVVAWAGASLALLGLDADGRAVELRPRVTSDSISEVLPLAGGRILVRSGVEVTVLDRGALRNLSVRSDDVVRHDSSSWPYARFTGAGTAVSWAPGESDDRAMLWDVSTGRCVTRLGLPYRDPGVTSLSPSDHVLAGTSRISVELWDATTGDHLARIGRGRQGGIAGPGVFETRTGQWTPLPGVDLGIDPAASLGSRGRVLFIQASRDGEAREVIALATHPFAFLGRVPTVETESRVPPEVIGDSCFLIRDDGAVCRWRPLESAELLVLEPPGSGARMLRLAGESGCWNSSWGFHCVPPPAGDANPPRGAVLLILRDDGTVSAQQVDGEGTLVAERVMLDRLRLTSLDPEIRWSRDRETLERLWSVHTGEASGKVTGPISVATGFEVSPDSDASNEVLRSRSRSGRAIPHVTLDGWIAGGQSLIGPEAQRIFVAAADGLTCQDLAHDGAWVGVQGDSVEVRHLHRGARRISWGPARSVSPCGGVLMETCPEFRS